MKIIEGDDGAKRALARLLAERKRGYSLAAPFYLDDAVFDLDIDGIFARHWFHIGSAPEVPRKGDYFTVEIGRYSIIVTRGEDMQIRAFHNVCRHRGSRICYEPSGHAKGGLLICPYHAWAFTTEGALRNARMMPDDFDKEAHALRQVHLKLVFLNPATTEDDIDNLLADIAAVARELATAAPGTDGVGSGHSD